MSRRFIGDGGTFLFSCKNIQPFRVAESHPPAAIAPPKYLQKNEFPREGISPGFSFFWLVSPVPPITPEVVVRADWEIRHGPLEMNEPGANGHFWQARRYGQAGWRLSPQARQFLPPYSELSIR
jgi:hypothetical protein